MTLTYWDANLDQHLAQITWGGGRRGQLWSQARTAIDTKAQQTLGMTGMNVKRKKYSSTFKTEWTSTFDTLGPSSASKFQAYCKLCWMDFSIEHSGKADCQRHVGTEKHKNVESQRGTSNIASFLVRETEADQIIKAEVQMSMLIAQSNASFYYDKHLNFAHLNFFVHSSGIV